MMRTRQIVNLWSCMDSAFSPNQRGIGVPAAVFVITTMAVIVVALNLLVQQSSQSFENEINLTRAFFAAESGVGFSLNGIYPPEEFPGYGGSTCAGTQASPIVYEFNTDGLGYCEAEVFCESVNISGTNYLTIQGTGSCDGISRTVQVTTSYND